MSAESATALTSEQRADRRAAAKRLAQRREAAISRALEARRAAAEAARAEREIVERRHARARLQVTRMVEAHRASAEAETQRNNGDDRKSTHCDQGPTNRRQRFAKPRAQSASGSVRKAATSTSTSPPLLLPAANTAKATPRASKSRPGTSCAVRESEGGCERNGGDGSGRRSRRLSEVRHCVQLRKRIWPYLSTHLITAIVFGP